jgi:hypothetical protein
MSRQGNIQQSSKGNETEPSVKIISQEQSKNNSSNDDGSDDSAATEVK